MNMKIEVNERLMDHLENLAKLRFSEEERKRIMMDMKKILEYMELLDEINVDGVPETYTVVENENEFREDKIEETEEVEKIRNNFPKRMGSFVIIPSIHGVEKK